MTGLEVLRSAEVGDHVFAGYGGPQPRVKRGAWENETLEGGFLWRVTAPYAFETTPVWPRRRASRASDGRTDSGSRKSSVSQTSPRTKSAFLAWTACTNSANTGGLLIALEIAPTIVSAAGALKAGETDDPAFLALDGDLDAVALVAVRREQRKLRARLFAGMTTAACALCGDELPLSLDSPMRGGGPSGGEQRMTS